VDELVAAAAHRPPGAGGLVVLPWLDGARAPWWDDTATAAIVGLRADTEPADLARGVLEGVAREVARVLEAMRVDADRDPSPAPAEPDRTRSHPPAGQLHEPDRAGARSGLGGEHDGLVLTGRGADGGAWMDVLAGVTGRPVQLRRSGQAAAAGAALATADALGQAWTLDRLDPVARRHQPDPGLVEHYRALAPDANRVASALITIGD